MDKNAKTEHVTCRIPARDAEIIKSEANAASISQSAMLAKILTNHVRWDRHAQKLGLIPVPGKMLSEIVTGWDDKRVEMVADVALEFMKGAVILLKGRYDLKRAIETLEEYVRATGMSSDHTVKAGMHHFTILHELGPAWSTFVRSMFQRLFAEFVPDLEVEFDIHDGAVSARIQLGAEWNEHDYSL